MIKSLTVSNYALIERLDTEFSPGLNIITGETGAGKSILLGALGILLGTRAEASAVGSAGPKAFVTAVFELSPDSEACDILRREGIDFIITPEGQAEVEIHRELTSSGRSSAFIGDSKVPLTVLKELGRHLVDIHSQHQTLLLADSSYQLFLLDRLGDNAALLEKYRTAHAVYRRMLDDYAKTKQEIDRTKADKEYLEYQLEEINKANINPEAWQNFEDESSRLESQIAEATACATALADLSSSEINACDLAEDALRNLQEVSGEENKKLDEAADMISRALVLLRQAGDLLGDISSENDTNPEALEEIRAAHNNISALMSRHGLSQPEELLEYASDIRQKLALVADAPQILANKERLARNAKKEAMLIARELSDKRRAVAANFRERLLAAARPLGMANLECDIAIESGKLNPDGIDTVDFLFAFNKNQTPLPLRLGASGGEMSRLMLAVKSVLADVVDLPTMVLDEIDTGVSGDIASKMAELMKTASSKVQVIAITHLPIVAASGDRHFKVYKQDNESRTYTSIEALGTDRRITEIATMLSGADPSEAALTTASQLLGLELGF